jgi:hypothetical protein
MSDKTIYAWSPSLNKLGLPIGGMVKGEHLHSGYFSKGRPIKEAIEHMKTFKGIQDALNRTKENKDFTESVHRTIKWAQDPYPIPFITRTTTKEILETSDTPNLSETQIPIVSKRVLELLNGLCPNDFEAFPIIVETPTGNSTNFYLLNITHIINPAIDEPNCKYKVWMDEIYGVENSIQRFNRLLFQNGCMKGRFLGRVFDNVSMAMIDQKIIEKFRELKVKGFRYIPLEDEVNKLYTFNHLPNGKLIGY